MTLDEIIPLIARGESETLELKQSTGQLGRAAETLCGFLNAAGGCVVLGVTPEGKLLGQQMSDKTQQDIANTLRKFEPPAPIEIERVGLLDTDRELIVLTATSSGEALPFVYDGRPYQRIGATTSVMPQERYQQLLLHRLHSRSRRENTIAVGVMVESLDQEEIMRTVRSGVAVGRLPESTGANPGDIVDRLGLRIGGQLLNAAVVLFGSHFLPDYPQCQLRMARFKGLDKTEFLDNRQIYGHGFHLLDEAMLFLQRHLPVAGRILPGLFERVDEPLFPLGWPWTRGILLATERYE